MKIAKYFIGLSFLLFTSCDYYGFYNYVVVNKLDEPIFIYYEIEYQVYYENEYQDSIISETLSIAP
jgi:hypothetical protein